ncbi:MAG: hypothetical protein HC895_01500 [Leptolyngbyaceae cyanobacterium SM1_3_5]|nr:hypothetical protein [Leptolyngbyaceae cyanobacterium SM1_3_5]
MSLVLVAFKQMQTLGLYESYTFNDAHIAIAQYKNNRVMAFDRVPNLGEIVRFPAPQGRGYVFFKVYEVQHLPNDIESLPTPNPVPQSAIFLHPLVVQ